MELSILLDFIFDPFSLYHEWIDGSGEIVGELQSPVGLSK
jgi:hypothetical protein